MTDRQVGIQPATDAWRMWKSGTALERRSPQGRLFQLADRFGSAVAAKKAHVMPGYLSDPAMFTERTFAAFLFDMDGTLVDSIAVTNRIWTGWAQGHGIDPDAVLRTMHGVRAVETIRRHLPQGDIEREAAVLTRAELEDMEGVLELAGAAAFLRTLPPRRWAVVTSAPRALALARLERAGIPVPPVLVTAEDVTRGKPAPDCFLLAARKLGVAPGDCLVWEDAPSGIAAAEAAGATVLVVTATHAHPMATSHPVVASYEGLAAGLDAAGRLTLALAGSRRRRGLTS